jgi:hypothetical protein
VDGISRDVGVYLMQKGGCIIVYSLHHQARQQRLNMELDL